MGEGYGEDRRGVAARLGENLARERRRAGLSQRDLAHAAGLDPTAISLLERGSRTPRLDTVLSLARALGVSVDELTRGIAWRPPEIEGGHFSKEPPSD